MLQVHLVHVLPQSWNQVFLKEPWFLLLEDDIRSGWWVCALLLGC